MQEQPKWTLRELQEDLPSRAAGFSFAAECKVRHQVAHDIKQLGLKLKYANSTIAMAVLFMHIFVSRHSLSDIHNELLGQVCLFLAGKSEETSRKARDVINVYYSRSHPDAPPPKIDDDFSALRDNLIENEQLLLRTLQYKVNFDLPHRWLLNYLKALKATKAFSRACFKLLHQSLGSTLMLEFDPNVLAVVVLFVTAKVTNVSHLLGNDLPPTTPWYTLFDVKAEELEHVSGRLLDYLEVCQTYK